ncbi:MAG: polyhydroxyalkanoate synthesis repressor PhaR [Gammaproteobacteria bacterium]
MEPRIIKKYPNRRLYDTAESKYITLEDVRKLVIDDVPFTVIDKKTGEDITRTILLQIILEKEDAGEPIFSTDVLHQLIGFYGNSVQRLASEFFNRGLTMIKQQQDVMTSQVSKAVNTNPLSAFADLTQQNLEMWRRMQEDFLRAVTPPPKPDPAKGSKPEPDDDNP